MELRKADLSDAGALFDWRNDPLTRDMSKDGAELLWDDHIAWLARRLERKDHGLYIAETDGVPVGTVRIDGEKISYTVAPGHRGKGLGEAMLVLACRMFGPKIAEIKRGNIASVKIAERAGHRVSLI